VHRAAYAAFDQAIDREEEAKTAFDTFHYRLVPNLLISGHELPKYEFCDEYLRRSYRRRVEELRELDKVAPKLAKQARKILDSTLKENLRLVRGAQAEEKHRKDSVGLLAAERELKKAMNAEDKAVMNICAYPCRTIEEVRRKAEYLTEHVNCGCEVSEEQMEALLKSPLAGKGAQS
jgi:hypothetical protein